MRGDHWPVAVAVAVAVADDDEVATQ